MSDDTPTQTKVEPIHPAVTSINAIVCDDDDELRTTVALMVRGMGFQKVISVDNGESAMAKLRQRSATLILCDWNMPIFNGLQIVEAVRSFEFLKDVAFVMMTGVKTKEKVIQAIRAGVDDYIVKPFGREELEQKILNALEKRGYIEE